MTAEEFAPILWATMQEKGEARNLQASPDFDQLGEQTRAMVVDTAEFVLRAAGQPDPEALDEPLVQGALATHETPARGLVLVQAGQRVLRMDAAEARSVGVMMIDAGSEAIFEAGIFDYLVSTGQNSDVALQAVEAMRAHRHDGYEPFVPAAPEPPAEPAGPTEADYDQAMGVLKTGEGGEAAVAAARLVVAAFESHG